MTHKTSKSFKNKLLALMGMRVVVAFLFLGVTTWFQLKGNPFTTPIFYPLYVIVAAIGSLTVFYALLIDKVVRPGLFAYVQLTLDVAIVTVIVYVTGGMESYLSILYPLSIIGSVSILYKRGGYYLASLSGVAYGGVLLLDFYGLLSQRYRVFYPPVQPLWEEVGSTIAVNVLSFFMVAHLAGYLAEKTIRMEKELEEKEIDFGKLERLNRLIAENIPSGIMTLDEKSRITSFNPAASVITGYTLKDVYYRDVEEVFPGLLNDTPFTMYETVRMEKDFRFKDGKEVRIGFTVSPGQEKEISNIVIFQDLTRVKVLEEQLRRDDKLKALGVLSASIAHEVRNPLASISGSIQVLREELKLEGEKGHLMEIVLRETGRLNSLITDFLLFAKPAREKTQWFNVSEVIKETLDVFSNSSETGRIVIESRLDDMIIIEGNRRQISQVFWNLFINSSNAMPDGGRLTVTTKMRKHGGADNGGSVEIEIGDTGVGIKQESLSKIFDPFFSTKEAGTGLGLSLVHRIVETHGGTIEVKSAVGRGTTFRIMLPVPSTHESHSL